MAGWSPEPIWTGAASLASTGNFFSLFYICTSFSWFPWRCLLYFTVQHTTQTFRPLGGLEPATPASDRPHTLALDRSATRIGRFDPRTIAIPSSLSRPTANRHSDGKWVRRTSHLDKKCGKELLIGFMSTTKEVIGVWGHFEKGTLRKHAALFR